MQGLTALQFPTTITQRELGVIVPDGTLSHIASGFITAALTHPNSVFICCPLTIMQGLTALQPLTTLTQLDLGGVLQTNEALGHIASCAQLQKLRITLYPETGLVTLEGFKQLTQLTALTELEVLHEGTNDELIFNNRVSSRLH